MRQRKPVTRRHKEGKGDEERRIDEFERKRRDDMATEGPKADSVPSKTKRRRRRTVSRSRESSIGIGCYDESVRNG